MALFEIKNRFDGSLIFKLECGSLKLCVEAAIKSRANLYGADLSGANLYGANLSRENLCGANLSRANLSRADLSGANLSHASLSRADLSRANLSHASLYGANLSRADLYGANLSHASLYGADLYGANLSRADLSGANLSHASLSGADLYGANLYGAKASELILAQQRITPTEGAFVGWKKLQGGNIAKLVIPHDAERMNSLGSRKCRASKAFVYELAVESYDQHTGKLLYKQGCEVVPDRYDPDVRVECSHGIHFFMTREEAAAY